MVGLPKGGGGQGECVLPYFLYNVAGAGNDLGDDFAAAPPGGFADFHHVPGAVVIEDRDDFRTGGETILGVCPHDTVGAVAEQTRHGLDAAMVGDQVVGVSFAEPGAPGPVDAEANAATPPGGWGQFLGGDWRQSSQFAELGELPGEDGGFEL